MQQLPHGMHLVGGQLPAGLRALDVSAADITDVICSHFHADHVGWLFDTSARPTFPRATIWFGSADWRHFVAGTGDMLTHIREGFRSPALTSRLRPIDQDTAVAPGITALLAPGHTPGHLCLVISSGQQPRPCSWATPSPAPSNSTNRPGTPSETSTRQWLTAPGDACGANSKASTPSAPARTSPNSNSGGFSPEPPDAGSPEPNGKICAPTASETSRPGGHANRRSGRPHLRIGSNAASRSLVTANARDPPICSLWSSLFGPVRWRRAERNSLSRCRYLLANARGCSAARNSGAWPRRYGSGLGDRSTDPSGLHADPDSLLCRELPGPPGWSPVVHPASPHSRALVAKCSP